MLVSRRNGVAYDRLYPGIRTRARAGEIRWLIENTDGVQTAGVVHAGLVTTWNAGGCEWPGRQWVQQPQRLG